MDIRLTGGQDETAAAVAALRACPGLRITAVSRPYPNRGDDQRVRLYLTAEAHPEDLEVTR